MKLELSQFDYHLPPERIAQFPLTPRDASKLLIVNRNTSELTDKHFFDLASELTSNDVLVLNNTKVFPARLIVNKGEKKVELLLEKEVSLSTDSITFSVLSKPGLKLGDKISIPNTEVEATCVRVEAYTRMLEFNCNREELFVILDALAKTPIPPYIKWNQDDEKALREKYQTVYARYQGAVAAPTAGLHFTNNLLETLKDKGIGIEYITLHVGLGTFLPVKTSDISAHHMHEEVFELDTQTALNLNAAKKKGRRIIAVGTTTVRVLETCVQGDHLVAKKGSTNIFIYPPYEFKFVDSLITNFHTPKSTLLMLVSTLVASPNTTASFTQFPDSLIGKAYEHALQNDYRFYSFGDAMWII